MSNKRNGKSEYTYKFINFMRMIKSKKYQKLNFDREKLSCVDVNLKAIENFNDKCKNFKELEGFNQLAENIKQMAEEDKNSNENCIDLLGIYLSPTNGDKANIFLSKEKIKEVAIEYDIEFDIIYNFVKIHEYAHASMCPKLAQYTEYNVNSKSASYVLIEESLATAIALKKMKNIADYDKLEDFVKHQPTQYRYGLELLNKYEKDIENIMILWKLSKYKEQTYIVDEVENFKSCEDIKTLFYDITNNTFFLRQEVKDIFFQNQQW